MTDTPTITLAGKEYPVPPLVPKQLKYVIPDLLQAMPAIAMTAEALRTGAPAPLKTENFDQLLRVIYWGIIWPNDPNRGDATKAIKLNHLEEMPLSLPDMIAAATLVQRQTGLFKPASPEGDTQGEAQPTG